MALLKVFHFTLLKASENMLSWFPFVNFVAIFNLSSKCIGACEKKMWISFIDDQD